MEINLKWRVQLFEDKNNLDLIIKILEEYVTFSKQNNFLPIFVFLPQKDDILFIKQNYHFYENMINEILKIKDLVFFDTTKELIQIKNLDALYSDDNDYGGHYSANGNKKISELIANELRKKYSLID